MASACWRPSEFLWVLVASLIVPVLAAWIASVKRPIFFVVWTESPWTIFWFSFVSFWLVALGLAGPAGLTEPAAPLSLTLRMINFMARTLLICIGAVAIISAVHGLRTMYRRSRLKAAFLVAAIAAFWLLTPFDFPKDTCAPAIILGPILWWPLMAVAATFVERYLNKWRR